jgi:hypothetical protein
MSWMSVIKWSQPRLTEGPHVPGQLRRRQRVSWQDVLRAVADVEMDIRRLHANKLKDRGMQTDGVVRMTLALGPGEGASVVKVTSDPALDPIKEEVAHLVANAAFPPSGQQMLCELDCTFGSADAGGFGGDEFGWDGGNIDDGGSGRGGFGDPF